MMPQVAPRRLMPHRTAKAAHTPGRYRESPWRPTTRYMRQYPLHAALRPKERPVESETKDRQPQLCEAAHFPDRHNMYVKFQEFLGQETTLKYSTMQFRSSPPIRASQRQSPQSLNYTSIYNTQLPSPRTPPSAETPSQTSHFVLQPPKHHSCAAGTHSTAGVERRGEHKCSAGKANCLTTRQIELTHALCQGDKEQHLVFCAFILEKEMNDEHFPSSFVFSDEAAFCTKPTKVYSRASCVSSQWYSELSQHMDMGFTAATCCSRRLECLPLTKVNRFCLIPGMVAHGNLPRRCHWSTGFLEDIPFSPPLHSDAAPYSHRFTLIS
ncbi:hypothetical protein PR048_029452 [Dryococelus australis]|uniref:Uncharacterized protein n=1 Tax=Dryococelus australis TaxID=614101 RepID=A0ABQ9GDE4_9NEOP|nr:hypothetical protein PR048_029452 [Dryococelus australis]